MPCGGSREILRKGPRDGVFEAVQRKFYVDSEDPTQPEFYASICDQFGINYGDFLSRFESQEVKQETIDEFNLNRAWGVRGYPTIILLSKDQLYLLANGYATFEEVNNRIESILKAEEA